MAMKPSAQQLPDTCTCLPTALPACNVCCTQRIAQPGDFVVFKLVGRAVTLSEMWRLFRVVRLRVVSR